MERLGIIHGGGMVDGGTCWDGQNDFFDQGKDNIYDNWLLEIPYGLYT